MKFADVLSQLTDLPRTFQRPGDTYQQWVSSLAEGLVRYTDASDDLTTQQDFWQASALWLEVWGRLYGIPRNVGEVDAAYRTRISGTLQATHGPPIAIEDFLEISLGIGATVSDKVNITGSDGRSAVLGVLILGKNVLGIGFPAGATASSILGKFTLGLAILGNGAAVPAGEINTFGLVGWTVALGAAASVLNYAAITASLNTVRPAGVPYNFSVLRGGAYLSTINYFGRPRATGAYLTEPESTISPDAQAWTNNAAALLPTTFLTDSVINS